MLAKTPVKLALVTLLVGAALAGRPSFEDQAIWWTAGVLLLGVFNVLFTAPGTAPVRVCTIALTPFALLSHNGVMVFAVLALLVWPPAFMVAWMLAQRTRGEASSSGEREAASKRARIVLAALIGAVAIAVVAYRLLVGQGLGQTAALFIGIPALLAIVVTWVATPCSAIGVAIKAVTVGLLVSMLFLWEGMICILMSAPLFYAMAILVASAIEVGRRRDQRHSNKIFSCLFLLALVPMSLEGVMPLTTVNREESIASSKIVHASSAAVGRALFQEPRFERALPPFLRIGFPWPEATRIEQQAGSTRWVIQVRGGEMLLNGMEHRIGDLVLELEESRPGLVRWRAASDSSHMTHFLTWREVVVAYEPVDAATTKVTWTLRYSRGLDPAWYFGPMERYAARLAAGYLIDAVATP
jgi:hypothetical protein